jgi:hypothetical protein
VVWGTSPAVAPVSLLYFSRFTYLIRTSKTVLLLYCEVFIEQCLTHLYRCFFKFINFLN